MLVGDASAVLATPPDRLGCAPRESCRPHHCPPRIRLPPRSAIRPVGYGKSEPAGVPLPDFVKPCVEQRRVSKSHFIKVRASMLELDPGYRRGPVPAIRQPALVLERALAFATG